MTRSLLLLFAGTDFMLLFLAGNKITVLLLLLLVVMQKFICSMYATLPAVLNLMQNIFKTHMVGMSISVNTVQCGKSQAGQNDGG